MPLMPEIPTWETSTINTQTFYGLNRGQSISEGELADMLNLTSDAYPVLSVRKQRGLPPTLSADQAIPTSLPVGMAGTQDKLLVCVGEDVYINGAKTGLTLSAAEAMCPKHIAIMGTSAYIWPDKKYINLLDPDEYGNMGQEWQAGDDLYISAAMCRKDGTLYDTEAITISDTAPEEPENLQLWLDTSGENSVLKQYSTIYQEWVQVATTYIKIQADGIGKGIQTGDAVFLSGAKIKAVVDDDTDPVPDPDPGTESDQQTLSFPSDSFSLTSRFTTSGGVSKGMTTDERTKKITVEGLPDAATIQAASVKFTAGSPYAGASLLTLNGVSFDYGEEADIPVEVTGNGEVSLLFRFRSGGYTTEAGSHAGSVTITDLRLEVTYMVSGMSTEGRGDNVDDAQIEALNTSNIVYACGDNYIVVAGLLHKALSLETTLKCELRIPDLDYVCEANNRLWGCTYVSVDGQTTNEIRCCALGDSRNWYRFEGTSMDSYVMSIGSDGKFTGAYSLQGTPLFFKEGYLHKISGTLPSNFALSTTRCRGVQEGCWRSLAVVNETLYYQSRHDVMAYDGSIPYAVGAKLGDETAYAASGGAYRDKYYLNRQTDSGSRTYVYDTVKSLWHVEDSVSIPWMATCMGQLVLAVDGVHASLLCIGSDTPNEQQIPWSATFGVFGYAYERAKYLSRFNIRAKMDVGSVMRFEIMYDSNGEWEQMGEMRSRTTRTFMLPIIPRRCDHCQVRISGTGNVSIFSIARIFEEGGN